MKSKKPPVCLTIAGLDPSGGAGIVADIKTFSRFGCYAAAVVTSMTFQNTVGVFGAEPASADGVRQQIEPVFDDLDVAAVKTGMLPTREIIETVAKILSERKPKHIVVDPVVRSTSGFDLIDNEALAVLTEKLFPLATVVTPNLPEAERISGIAIESEDDIIAAAAQMTKLGAEAVLIKGGHLFEKGRREEGEKGRRAVDYLFVGQEMRTFEADFIETTATHGTGCTLASAIAANLALGNDLEDSVRIAKGFVTEAIRTAPGLGKGNSPINLLSEQTEK